MGLAANPRLTSLEPCAQALIRPPRGPHLLTFPNTHIATGYPPLRSTMAFVLGTNNHGKGRVRLLKVSQMLWAWGLKDRQPCTCTYKQALLSRPCRLIMVKTTRVLHVLHTTMRTRTHTNSCTAKGTAMTSSSSRRRSCST